MLQLTKIFHFEMAHAIHGYPGACKNIHGHSYELHVTVSSVITCKDHLPAPGFIMDFKEIKKWVTAAVIEPFDHKLVLSRAFLLDHPSFATQENLVTRESEPSAENLLASIQQALCEKLPDELRLVRLRLYETNDSYAEWINDNQDIR